MDVTWIRGPWWDGFWILSAPLLGLLLVLFPGLLAVFLTINFAHAISPIVMAWTHKGYRPYMLRQSTKFIGVPVAVFALAVTVACCSVVAFPGFQPRHTSVFKLTFRHLDVPIVLWANVHALWNIYHGGAQNFGIWCLYRRGGYTGWQKQAIRAAFVLMPIVLLLALPGSIASSQALVLFVTGFLTFNHSLAEIGLCAHVHSRHWHISPWWFVVGVLIFGLVSSSAYSWGLRQTVFVGTLTIAIQGALGITHFLQDRWSWRMGNPVVRDTIGRELAVCLP